MNIKISTLDELRLSLKKDGYGVYLLSNGKKQEMIEIDYIPKTDKFLVCTLKDGVLQRYTPNELLKTNIGENMRTGHFLKKVG